MPVTISGQAYPTFIEYVSMIHAIVCSSVPRSGAITSTRGPMIASTSSVNRRVRRSFSSGLSAAGSQAMPPLAPANGRFMIPHFQLIHMASAATSPRSTDGA